MAPRPTTFEFIGETYRTAKVSAFDQHKMLRLLDPVLNDFRQRTYIRRGRDFITANRQMEALTTAVSSIEAESLADLFDVCLAGIERATDDGWHPIYSTDDQNSLFEDLTAGRLVALVVRIVLLSLMPFFTRKSLEFKPTPGPSYSHEALYDGLSWLLMPVERGFCRYESLKDGTLDLTDIALMNDQIAVTAENTIRAQKAAQAEAERR